MLSMNDKTDKTVLFWMRRDLRLYDNAGLAAAQSFAKKEGHTVIPVFVFDKVILDKLPLKNDARITHIFDTVHVLNNSLKTKDDEADKIAVVYGNPIEEIPKLAKKYQSVAVFTNEDYEPYARYCDSRIQERADTEGIDFKKFKDQVVFDYQDILKDDGSYYTVYTPYSNKWLKTFDEENDLKEHAVDKKTLSENTFIDEVRPSLEDMGFGRNDTIQIPGIHLVRELLMNYENTRNIPGNEHGTSRIGVHLRFGTVSIRECVRKAIDVPNNTFLKELIWREFYMMILAYRPDTVTHAFKEQYNIIPWRDDADAKTDFEKWTEGETGYPLIDAGMRQLVATGYMHNRVRMVCASFLTKHLLINWQWGERHFAAHLLDYEQANNVGGWQWAAGTGADASPYFRVFNPYTQHKKFDPDDVYVKRWLPEYGTDSYPDEMIEHTEGRERALEVFKTALDSVK